MAETGFYNTGLGYWQTIDGDPVELLKTFPAGTVQVPLKPGADYEWTGGAWVATAPAVAATVPKSVVMARVTAQGKMAQAQAALWAAPDLFAKWFAPDQPIVNRDDPATVAFIKALGLDPTVILAP